MSQTIQFGYGSAPALINLNQLNRHGIIAGATGTGKTVTLKVLAEQLSKAGVPVFLADIKGDLTSLAQSNNGDVDNERLAITQYTDYEPAAFPVELWDVLGENGIPLRMTISEMGPVLLSRILGLNDVQTGILNIVFSVADEKGLLLIDLMDLRAMLNYVLENAKELSQHYGNIAASSVGAILRSIVVLEQQGAKSFFGEPALELADLMRTDAQGQGVINILNAVKLSQQPTLYATVLLAVLANLYETLPEVGDLAKPKLVFFFDEAHLMFNKTPDVLLEKIELIVRLIRSKGVSVFFVTQNPLDIPERVASQLGNRIQHGLRAFTPKEIKTVNAVADSFRQAADADLASAIQSLKVGQAVVSTLNDDGTPKEADIVTIWPPQSHLGTVDFAVQASVINESALIAKYETPIDRESAHEMILAQTAEREQEILLEAERQEAAKEQERLNKEFQREQERLTKEAEKARARQEKATQKSSTRRTDTPMDRFTKNIMSSVGRELGRAITRGITGMLKK
ncbi:DUF853 family protein [Tuanshanicoccus lijuaniae]|uniref:helicase HerA-like domain-containing protein n=1 Tax=Aerococcaceae bacterium zg-1292 TaxID=2774330 RepID=UPI001935C39E|nr:DUF853 family protein [Aerococcaceae bacterium zg-1292]MBD3949489.1 DUF853 family protein [Aerococcaceae bacterium zg-1292]QQA36497.1 DUF853 family protein [Aerococcaceae bacterium zg-1292]